VFDILVQSRRNAGAAKRFFGKLLRGCETRDPARRRASPEPLPQ
jgi:transposase-like protein